MKENNQSAKDVLSEIGSGKMGSARARNLTGQIREAFDEITRLQKIGYSLDAIVSQLNKAGIKISVNTLRSLMTRIRKEREKEALAMPLVKEIEHQTQAVIVKEKVAQEEKKPAVKSIAARPVAKVNKVTTKAPALVQEVKQERAEVTTGAEAAGEFGLSRKKRAELESASFFAED